MVLASLKLVRSHQKKETLFGIPGGGEYIEYGRLKSARDAPLT